MNLMSASPIRPQLDEVAEYRLDKRPTTHALLLRASQVIDDSGVNAKAALGVGVGPQAQAFANLEQRINEAACLVALEIVKDATNAALDNKTFMPGSKPSGNLGLRYGHVVLAFAQLVKLEILTILHNEGYPLAFKNFPAAKIVSSLFIKHSVVAKTKLAEGADKIIPQVLQADSVNILEWRANLGTLLYSYLRQFTATDESLKSMDFRALFGSALKIFLAYVG